MNKQKFVVGFGYYWNFDLDTLSVVLIRKNKPAWQRGLLNGVGGKVEPGETPLQAMAREFREETGVEDAITWQHFATLEFPAAELFVFRSTSPKVASAKTTEDEEIEHIAVRGLEVIQCVPNLRWLIPLGRDLAEPQPAQPIHIYYNY